MFRESSSRTAADRYAFGFKFRFAAAALSFTFFLLSGLLDCPDLRAEELTSRTVEGIRVLVKPGFGPYQQDMILRSFERWMLNEAYSGQFASVVTFVPSTSTSELVSGDSPSLIENEDDNLIETIELPATEDPFELGTVLDEITQMLETTSDFTVRDKNQCDYLDRLLSLPRSPGAQEPQAPRCGQSGPPSLGSGSEDSGLPVWKDGVLLLPIVGEKTDRYGWRSPPFGRRLRNALKIWKGRKGGKSRGARTGRLGRREFHNGLDIAAPQGTPVLSATSGSVSEFGRKGRCGLSVRVQVEKDVEVIYCHLSKILVTKVGEPLTEGSVIGLVGRTGRATGPHLHLILKINGETVDPEPRLRTREQPR